MLLLSLGLLAIAALFGGVLAAMHPRLRGSPLGALHGMIGLAGIITLLLALRGPPRGEDMGVASFGRVAALLLAMALMAGLALLVMRLRHRQMPGLVIGVHGTIAVSAVVVLAAYIVVG